MLRALIIVFACLAAGEVFLHFTHLKLPASIAGLLILFGLLQAGWVKDTWLKPLTEFLMQHMMLLMIPACVALMDYFSIVVLDFWSIVLATLASTILVLLSSAKTHEILRKRQ
ncbi:MULTISPECIES: CidA/LrgA family protein [Eikenella]|uniref:Murein hydrolase transporter LrgA n=1 Tax=Eikenella longinqua TaxID=1795827 RepID=A0A1A9RXS0_9NEIS|nr:MULTISPECIES: CidA/LrgA family protein [Eikenella]OAM29055.1 murein hydrolase transporter LrgA [Eikenella longinqua]